jgi:ABC-type multidrug transport system ATPase subunit
MRPFAIATTGLARSFGRIRAVAGLDLGVPVGSVYGFLGPNGAGKTTTIRMLLGLIWPDQGEIRLFDRAVTPATRREALRRIGALVDAPSLYPHLTGRENLQVTQGLVGLPASSVDRALQLVQLGRDASRLVSSYSLGMRQRLGLALALLGEPDLLILDEPTNGLDPAGTPGRQRDPGGGPAHHRGRRPAAGRLADHPVGRREPDGRATRPRQSAAAGGHAGAGRRRHL